jgi:hypothetical protein
VVDSGRRGSRASSPDERSRIAEAIAQAARTVPVVAPIVPGPDGETANIEATLSLDIRPVDGSEAEGVIAVWGQAGAASRLIYGELRSGEYQALWDSPLFESAGLSIEVEGLDGDLPTAIELLRYWKARASLVILDLRGRELTRQDCSFDPYHPGFKPPGFSPRGRTCPIFAQSIELDRRSGSLPDILARAPIGASGARETGVYRFSLRNGAYSPRLESQRP